MQEPKHEPALIAESHNDGWYCSGCGKYYDWTKGDRVLDMEHCPECCGTKIKCPAKFNEK